MSEGAIFLLGWMLLLIVSLFSVCGVLRLARWWVERS